VKHKGMVVGDYEVAYMGGFDIKIDANGVLKPSEPLGMGVWSDWTNEVVEIGVF